MQSIQQSSSQLTDREYWLEQMLFISTPVLTALSERQLKERMPIEIAETAGANDEENAVLLADRAKYTHLEALGRLLSGMAPWLENKQLAAEAEEETRSRYAALAREAIDAGTDPESPDYMNFSDGFQPIVDAAFLAQAILRAPVELGEKLEQRVRANVVAALKQTRSRKPVFSNWLLFAATIESALFKLGERDWDPMRIDYALKQHEQWYLGDGAYGDGPEFHWDYYNSFVIQPMLVDVLAAVGEQYEDWKAMRPAVASRAQRYAEVLERLIGPDGTYPPIGRSLAYRFGAFQSLAQSAWLDALPEGVSGAQVRCALTAAIRRTLEIPGNFTADGWLTIGFCGHQKDIGERYISTGSLYLCSEVFLPLGLPLEHPFWSGAADNWTSKKAWSGQAFGIDTALK
ncbi:hypothetical protein BK133_21945 [Paenibacillus sp. FSL H8-0548]|uniref:DUF2264 domain-containing protein n=1 Tax=Paenibacillus sp. FSL H8-0548 TaxID=1920422 RepID=UPI00096FF503|nr:DUF2264 domain-containing protein [Paenibacillus sp. FSL H8-0548]OMF24940.1 hypothetical protein BK133_21945 [Paenibacillus sp. FSL H8-0548]